MHKVKLKRGKAMLNRIYWCCVVCISHHVCRIVQYVYRIENS